MIWLFAALWKLPASNSLTRTATAPECVYGSVGGPKRPRRKVPMRRIELKAIGLVPEPLVSRLGRQLPKRHSEMPSKLRSANPRPDRVPVQGTWIVASPESAPRRAPDRQEPQVGIDGVDGC